jgi:ribosomal protein S18 acetylase RimI-like enzyme
MEIILRELSVKDKSGLEDMLSRVREFNAEDQALAMELVQIALEQPDQKDYYFFIAADTTNQIVGFVCYGPTPLTQGTYDLYWIAVEPSLAGNGVGGSLLKTVEDTVCAAHGRLMVIETSSDPIYERTRGFYLKNGYILAETIKDFYRDGEDRVTYIKRLIP